MSTAEKHENEENYETRIYQLTHTHISLGLTWPYRKKFTKKSREKWKKNEQEANEYICNKSSLSIWEIECWHFVNCIFIQAHAHHTNTMFTHMHTITWCEETCSFLIVIHNLDFHNHRPLHQQSNCSDWIARTRRLFKIHTSQILVAFRQTKYISIAPMTEVYEIAN